MLVVTHSNELFEMFTLNRYTVAFFEKYFNVSGLENLLVNWNKPNRFSFPMRENPLSYSYKMQRYGFLEEQQEFSIPHLVPPLLDIDFNPDDLASRKIASTEGFLLEERWKLFFICSIFGSRLNKA